MHSFCLEISHLAFKVVQLTNFVSNMARRGRSAVFSLALVGAVTLISNGPAWIFSPSRATAGAAHDSRLLAAGSAQGAALIIASMPEPAYAGGMFDFGLTLPFVAVTFLTMMAVLNALWYSPVGSEVDERNEALLKTLSQATDMLTKADEIQVQYTEQIREAREKATSAVGEYRAKTEAAIQAEIKNAQDESTAKAAEVRAQLQADIQAKMKSAEGEIEKKKTAFVKQTLASVAL